MGIGNHELIEFEQDHHEDLFESFVKEHEKAWNEQSHNEDYDEVFDKFVEQHKDAWHEHVMDAYNDYMTGGH